VIRILLLTLVWAAPGAYGAEGDCGREKTTVIYSDPIDYEIACKGIASAQQMVRTEYGFKTDAEVKIEFKAEVTFSYLDDNGKPVTSQPVYGMYVGTENRVEMSAFTSKIVQNLEREHFGLQIKKMDVSEEKKAALLREIHQSVVVHELTHLFNHHNFRYRPPGHGVHEYLAYIVQLKFLNPELRALILESNDDVFTNDYQINPLVHGFAPHKFGVMSYRHFEELGERKAQFLDDILSGKFNPDTMFDMPM
jgi:hypothetical protein